MTFLTETAASNKDGTMTFFSDHAPEENDWGAGIVGTNSNIDLENQEEGKGNEKKNVDE